MKTIELNGYIIKITVHHDHDMGEPWKEHDGHGIVSDWEHRDKRPGELVLNTDHGSKRFYDLEATMKLAKTDGWGLNEDSKAQLAAKLGRKPTAKEVLHAAVMSDYEYLRGWCNDEWSWLGYTTEIETPDGVTIEGDSCWGFDDEKYMLEDAEASAQCEIERHQLTQRETAIAACCP